MKGRTFIDRSKVHILAKLFPRVKLTTAMGSLPIQSVLVQWNCKVLNKFELRCTNRL